MQKLLVWVIGIVVLGIGAYAFLAPTAPSGDGAMMEKDTLQKDEMQKDPMDGAGEMTEGDSMKKDDAMMDEGAMMEKGTYEPYAPEKLALAEKGKVVLFFHADWCPICRGLEADIRANPGAIPAGVHILKVDYDTATSLKQKYGVTYQHTFVQVDAQGNRIAKWGDATTLAQTLARVK